MRIRSPEEQNRSEISVVPLVNVVFLLLVFFMLVGRVTSPDPLSIDPPRSESGIDDTGGAVKIYVTRDGRVALGSETVPVNLLGERIAGLLDARPSASFQLKADAQGDGVRLIRVMEQLRGAGVERLTLLTEQGPPRR